MVEGGSLKKTNKGKKKEKLPRKKTQIRQDKMESGEKRWYF